MIRIAEPGDLDLCLSMAMKFAESSPYSSLVDYEVVKAIVTNFLNGPTWERLILTYEDKGFLAAAVTPFVFGTAKVATEVAWWVDPAARKEGVGDRLIEAFEFWADKVVHCKVKTLAFMDKDLSKYMNKKGYVPYETAHYKMN